MVLCSRSYEDATFEPCEISNEEYPENFFQDWLPFDGGQQQEYVNIDSTPRLTLDQATQFLANAGVRSAWQSVSLQQNYQRIPMLLDTRFFFFDAAWEGALAAVAMSGRAVHCTLKKQREQQESVEAGRNHTALSGRSLDPNDEVTGWNGMEDGFFFLPADGPPRDVSADYECRVLPTLSRIQGPLALNWTA